MYWTLEIHKYRIVARFNVATKSAVQKLFQKQFLKLLN